MVVRNGITPRRFWIPLWGYVRYTDHRDKELHRTFGAVAQVGLNGQTFVPMEYNYDACFGVPNQNVEGYPNGCTGYAQSSIAEDADRNPYVPEYTYEKTLEMQGLPMGSPCDIRTSLKSTVVYGVQRVDETTDVQAEQHRQGAYFNVDKVPGMDWFDSLRLALRNNPNRSLSMATPWFPEFHQWNSDGVLPSSYTGNPDTMTWHNHKMSGETNINGIPYLLDASWQGPNVGRGGWLLWSRELTNKIMEISGTEAFMRKPAGQMSVQRIQLTIIETILSYIGMYLSKIRRS